MFPSNSPNVVTPVTAASNSGSNNNSAGKQVTTVYLSPTQTEEITGWGGWLIKRFHLDVYETRLLSRRALFDLKALALLLTIVFIFDFAAWSLFWNMIFNSSNNWTFNLILTPLAFTCALMISSIIIIYERQWVVSDVSRFTWKILVALLIRASVIGIAAIATAQPVEVITFSGQIQKRIHEESVFIEAKKRLPTYKVAVDEAGGREGDKDSVRDKTRQETLNKSKEAEDRENGLKAKVNQAQESLENANGALRRAQASYNRKYPKAGQRRIAAAQQRVNTAQSELNTAQTALGTNQNALTRAQDKAKLSDQELIALQDKAKETKQLIKNWIADVAGSKLNEPKVEPNFKWVFKDEDYDFFERLSILKDLYDGEAPRLPDLSDADIKYIKDEFGLGASVSSGRIKRDSEIFVRWWWSVFLVALVIPFLVLAAKLLMSKDLVNYYSDEAQVRTLNYDAISLNTDLDENGRMILRKE